MVLTQEPATVSPVRDRGEQLLKQRRGQHRARTGPGSGSRCDVPASRTTLPAEETLGTGQSRGPQ